MVTERRNFQKVFDLSERFLPNNIETSLPNETELGQFYVIRALSSYSIAQEKEIQLFMQPESRDSHYRAVVKEQISNSLAG